MRNIPDKINGDSIQDYEWNPAQEELENIVTDTGQTLNPADSHQASKAASIYAGSGDYYIDSGSANAYVLSPVGSKQSPIAYIDGLRIRFVPANNNTTSSQITISGLSAKDVKKGSFISTPSSLVTGDINTNYITEAIYNASLDCFILNPACYTQILVTAQLPTGSRVPMEIPTGSPPAGWIPDISGTIGSSGSGSSVRANDDCLALYTLWWTNLSYDPVVGGRGASASVDFIANKKLNIPTSANRVIANASGSGFGLGAVTGSSTHGITINESVTHTHVVNNTAGPTAAADNIQSGGGWAYYKYNNITTTSSGSSAAMSLMQPTYFSNIFIKL